MHMKKKSVSSTYMQYGWYIAKIIMELASGQSVSSYLIEMVSWLRIGNRWQRTLDTSEYEGIRCMHTSTFWVYVAYTISYTHHNHAPHLTQVEDCWLWVCIEYDDTSISFLQWK